MTSRSEALRWSHAVRSTRQSVCTQLGSAEAGLAEVFEARQVPVVGELYVLVVLEALPGALKVATRRKLAELGIDGRTRLADLDAEEVGVLLDEFDPSGSTASPEASGVPDQ